jgi:DNA-binding beta-propeller fold protein YncE
VLDRIPVGADPGGTTSTEDTFYVSAAGDDTIYVLDDDGAIVDQLSTGDGPGGLAVTDTDLWVAISEADMVGRIPLG